MRLATSSEMPSSQMHDERSDRRTAADLLRGSGDNDLDRVAGAGGVARSDAGSDRSSDRDSLRSISERVGAFPAHIWVHPPDCNAVAKSRAFFDALAKYDAAPNGYALARAAADALPGCNCAYPGTDTRPDVRPDSSAHGSSDA